MELVWVFVADVMSFSDSYVYKVLKPQKKKNPLVLVWIW